jgi:AcrR family transcriptional regulator
MPRPRGRPRKYDPDTALEAALRLFWRNGYSATSLADLAAATRMNRPSLYAAFGDKEALYLKALERFAARAEARYAAALAPRGTGDDVGCQLARYFDVAVELYSAEGRDGASGCMVLSTAPAESTCKASRELASATVAAIDGQLLHALEGGARARRASPRDRPPHPGRRARRGAALAFAASALRPARRRARRARPGRLGPRRAAPGDVTGPPVLFVDFRPVTRGAWRGTRARVRRARARRCCEAVFCPTSAKAMPTPGKLRGRSALQLAEEALSGKGGGRLGQAS